MADGSSSPCIPGEGGVGHSWFCIELVSYPLLPLHPRNRVQPTDGEVELYSANGTVFDSDIVNGYVVIESRVGRTEPYVVTGSVVDALRGGVLPGFARSGEFEISRSGFFDGDLKSGTIVDLSHEGIVQQISRFGVVAPIRVGCVVGRISNIGGVVTSYSNNGIIYQNARDGQIRPVSRSGTVESFDVSGVISDIERGGNVE